MINFNDEILNLIKKPAKNYEAYIVGGYLRNYFINNKISCDRDIVIRENAERFAGEIANLLDATFIELDRENKIYRVVLKDKENYFDIAQAVENDILKDALRRDFTINSIFYDLNKEEIFDPLNGISDIKNKILRTSNLNNFIDDPLRFLRLYRFYSKTAFKIDEKLLDFTKQNFYKISSAAPERINYEIMQIFEAEYTPETLEKMYDDGVLEIVFPFVKEIKRIPPNSHHHLDLIHHSIETVRNIRTNKPLLKLSAFYHDIGKPATWTIEPVGRHRFIGHDIKGGELVKQELEKLKFSNKQIAYVSKMVRFHIYPASLINIEKDKTKKAYARFVKKLGSDTPDIIELSRADRLSARGEAVSNEMINMALSHLDNLLNYYNEVKDAVEEPKTFLDGKEIMEILNIKPSKTVGIILDKLKEAQILKEINSKEEAIDFIKNNHKN